MTAVVIIVLGMAVTTLVVSLQLSRNAASSAARVQRLAATASGGEWRIAHGAPEPPLSVVERALPWWEGLAGLLVTLILAAGVPTYRRTRRRIARAAAALRQAKERSEARFAAIFEQEASGVAVTRSKTGRWVRINRTYAKILGYTREELSRLDYATVTHPADLALDRQGMNDLLEGRVANFSIEKRMVHKSGRIVWVRLTVSPMWEPDGKIRNHIAVIQDITQRKLAEEAVRQEEIRFRLILDHLPTAIALIDGSDRIIYRNKRYEALLGYSPAQMRDTGDWWSTAYPPHEGPWAKRRWQALCAQARAGRGIIAPSERTILCADGDGCPVRIGGVLLEEGYLVTIEDLREHKAAEERIHYLAYYDPLTRLPNGHALLEHLRNALARPAGVRAWGAVLRLDVDHFRHLNETRGQNYGDELLTKMAGKLLSYTQHHPVARVSHDEFVVILDDLHVERDEAARKALGEARALLALLNTDYKLIGSNYRASVSIGVALYRGGDVGAQELLKRTTTAVVQARGAGTGTHAFFDPGVQRALDERARVEGELREAIEAGALELHLQPQVEGGCIIGAEALVRWRHPTRGLVAPGLFIALAEETGLIVPLGDWVLREACSLLAAWRSHARFSQLALAVNVSPRQFYQANFARRLRMLIEQSRVNAARLKIEVTEGLLLRDVESTVAKMAELRELGVTFSLDDFGTGYSSLAYLCNLPISEIKIDKGFVQRALGSAADAAIVRTVLTLGDSLGLRVVAEGVETLPQRRWLSAHGCNRWQGFLLSKALPVREFEAFVQSVSGGAARDVNAHISGKSSDSLTTT